MTRTLIAALLIGAMARLAGASAAPSKTMQSLSAKQSKMLGMIHGKMQKLMEECKKDPNAWQPRYKLGKLLFGFGRYKSAAADLDRAIALKPDYQPAYALAGRAYCMLKDYDTADKRLAKAIELDPKDKTSQQWRVRVSIMAEQNERVAKLTTRLKENPADPKILLELGRVYSRQGEWEQALSTLRGLIEGTPNVPAEALALAGTAHYRLGNYAEAVRLFERAVKTDPKNKRYRQDLTQAQQRYQIDRQLEQLVETLNHSPKNGKLHYQAGVLYSRILEWPRAAAHFERATSLLPENPETHRAFAIALFRLGKMDAASEEMKTCIKLAPKNKEYPKILATMERVRNMHGAMSKMRKSNPGGRNPMAGMGMMMGTPRKTVPDAGTRPKMNSQK